MLHRRFGGVLNAFLLAAGLKKEAGSGSYHQIMEEHSCHMVKTYLEL